jgi:type I restriction enzyme R subunit
LKEYYLTPDEEKKIRKDFIKKTELPKILIVTEKLLTGFDAPILYCMYLDKPMRDHVLLQAIARVNRPYEDEEGLVKPYGFVFDFVGIFEKLEKALAFDSDIVASVIQNVDVLKQLFATLMKEKAEQYLPLTKGWDDKSKERAIEYFAEKDCREEFNKFFRQLQNLYDILSPDAFLRRFIEPYQALAQLFWLIHNAYDSIYVDKELTSKTQTLLREHASTYNVQLPGEVHQLGPKELAAIKDGDASDTTKILNLRKILTAVVGSESGSKPFLLTIGERADALAQAYEDRQQTTQQVLDAFERLAQEYVDADEQRRQLGVDENAFAIYKALSPFVKDLTVAKVTIINDLFVKYTDYRWNDKQETGLRKELYNTLRPLVEAGKKIQAANALIGLQRV